MDDREGREQEKGRVGKESKTRAKIGLGVANVSLPHIEVGSGERFLI
jgi:hypothetical protein